MVGKLTEGVAFTFIVKRSVVHSTADPWNYLV